MEEEDSTTKNCHFASSDSCLDSYFLMAAVFFFVVVVPFSLTVDCLFLSGGGREVVPSPVPRLSPGLRFTSVSLNAFFVLVSVVMELLLLLMKVVVEYFFSYLCTSSSLELPDQ